MAAEGFNILKRVFARNNPEEEVVNQKALTGAVDTITGATVIGKAEIAKAIDTLKKYKDGKANLEKAIVENEQWYKGRHWDLTKNQAGATEQRPEPASAWLFNSLANKHADAMDNYPQPNVLPREQGDKMDAKILSSIIPVILERNEFEETYSDAWWYKLKNGVVPYGVFWNNSLEDGLGDIDVKKLDLLNIFWEAGVTDIQQSRNLFIVSLKDNDLLEAEYPALKGKLGGKIIDVQEYVYDDTVDTSDKTVVVDWYYKKNGILHYCKFVNETVLFASENDTKYREGWYKHGMYPVVFDVLFPEEGTPIGFGYLAIMKDPQMYIDKLSQVILENAVQTTRVRYWGRKGMGINKEQFLDWNEPIVEVEGQIDDERLKPIEVPTLSGNVLNVLQMKIDELKETSSNRDVSQGSSSGGVTAAAAIAALQEAGNKTSRDMISASYRAYTKINHLIIELIRQFYDETRNFRIVGTNGAYEYVQYNNKRLQAQMVQPAYAGQQAEAGYSPTYKRPIFDIVIKPQKRSAYSRMAQNELAKELYGMNLFDPANAEPSMTCLEMMEFDGIEEVKQKVQQGHTLVNMIEGLNAQLQQLNQIVAQLTGGRNVLAEMQMAQQQQPASKPQQGNVSSNPMALDEPAKAPMTNYGEELAKRATPSMEG